MTRDFNNQRRNDSRPSFRNQSPNRRRDEQSPRPARPRLNRETVDRAWESGAQQRHADYRPRGGNGQNRPQGQQRTTGWSNSANNRQSGYSSQNGRSSKRPYDSRQENYRDSRQGNYRDDHRDNQRGFERTPNYSQGSRSFSQDRRGFGDQRFSDRRDSFDRQGRTGNRQQFQNRGNQRRDFGRDDRPSRSFHGDRPQQATRTPRWQSRPTEPRNYASRDQQQEPYRNPRSEELFEGDYERFEDRNSRPSRAPERPSSSNRYSQGSRNRQDERESEPQERHVTRLPDGRVLKGPRSVQRKNAQFWTGIAENTDELVDRVAEASSEEQENIPVNDAAMETTGVEETAGTSEAMNEEALDVFSTEGDTPSTAPQKRRTRTASAAVRAKKSVKSDTTVPRPSQRGYKWPTQQ